MQTCPRCKKQYRGDDTEFCIPCEEYIHQVRRETKNVICLHCGESFSAKRWDRHRWTIYYRIGGPPKRKKAQKKPILRGGNCYVISKTEH